MRILTVIGARPQFIKAAPMSNEIRKRHEEIIVHTGQHHDSNMSDIFFEELQIPKPKYNLGINGKSHGAMTGEMLAEIEKIIIEEKPDAVLVYGDTNSTLAGALAASKLLIPVIHIESGLRSRNMNMPEEQNRILTDHISKLLFTPTDTANNNLQKEGIVDRVFNVGDIMYDATLMFRERATKDILKKYELIEKEYILATIHRAENTDNLKRLKNIVEALNQSKEKIVLPIHPRTRNVLEKNKIRFEENILIIEPVGYLEILALEMNAKKILTDSGGIQKEAYFLNKPCITMRDETEWIETIDAGWNLLVGANKEAIVKAINEFVPYRERKEIFGDGKTAEKIMHIIESELI